MSNIPLHPPRCRKRHRRGTTSNATKSGTIILMKTPITMLAMLVFFAQGTTPGAHRLQQPPYHTGNIKKPTAKMAVATHWNFSSNMSTQQPQQHRESSHQTPSHHGVSINPAIYTAADHGWQQACTYHTTVSIGMPCRVYRGRAGRFRFFNLEWHRLLGFVLVFRWNHHLCLARHGRARRGYDSTRCKD